jgi:hypothetical protein
MANIVIFYSKSLLILIFTYVVTKKKKEREFIYDFYGRFLRTSIVTAKPTAIAMIIPMTAGTKY